MPDECLNHAEHAQALYTLQIAAELICIPHQSLRQFLVRHPEYPVRYRFYRQQYETHSAVRRVRILTATEVKRLQAHWLKGPGRATAL